MHGKPISNTATRARSNLWSRPECGDYFTYTDKGIRHHGDNKNQGVYLITSPDEAGEEAEGRPAPQGSRSEDLRNGEEIRHRFSDVVNKKLTRRYPDKIRPSRKAAQRPPACTRDALFIPSSRWRGWVHTWTHWCSGDPQTPDNDPLATNEGCLNTCLNRL